MLCENKIRDQFPYNCNWSKYELFFLSFRAAIFESFGFVLRGLLNLVPRAVFINSPGTGHEVLNSDWPIKTHNPRSKILESRQINFRAFRQSNKTPNCHCEENCFPRTTDASRFARSTIAKWPK